MTDEQRIDKLERLAKKSFGHGGACFQIQDGELCSLPFDPGEELMTKGWHATVREAIDAAEDK